ncbi:hypothetical protein DB30_02883 [Enhygromyxa salina]|uniref:Multiple EGF-like-domain protein 3 n=1 Tax=Enhygromyxa salina TaxID=215803 RepID=A0A0C1Z2K4_9BACT|nr:hypothetical protein DB30_02883 [Enhygromyxa salina]
MGACTDDTVSADSAMTATDTESGGAETDTEDTGTTGDGDGDPATTGDGDGDEPEAECGNGVLEADEECDDGNAIPNDACTNNCTLPACGDGIIQAGEACDAGADNGPNSACLDSCEENVCGDGYVGPGEGCDDGNDDDDDACTNACAPTSCGDGVLQAQNGEQCDDANDDNGDGCLDTCAIATCGDSYVQVEDGAGEPLPLDQQEACDDGPQNADTAGCTNSCQIAACGDGLVYEGIEACDNGADNGPMGTCLDDCADNVCGDTFLGPDEACDDGNANDDDGCSSTCELEGCGDMVVQDNEDCDDGQNGDNDDGCTDECRFESCGDGYLQDDEACDEGGDNANSGDCTLACTVATCGDGFVWANNEECDNGPQNDDNAECTLACNDAVCGDGLVGPGEGCDDGNNMAADGCSPTCISEECGNQIVDPGEACDDGNDVDDDECTNACTIPIPCDGPYVSKDTCIPNDQCGTVSRPWCTISTALINSISSPIRVAGAGNAYFEQVSMRSGYDVFGGHEPTFVAPRNPDPETNNTVIYHYLQPVEWFGAVTDATLDGFRVQLDGLINNENQPQYDEAIYISGSANATVRNVIVEPLEPGVYATRAYAVYIGPGNGGTILIDGLTELRPPRASSVSAGLGIAAGVTPASLSVDGASIHGGTASNSYGIEHLGRNSMTLTNVVIEAGTVTGQGASAGVLAGTLGYGQTSISQSTIHGGVSRHAVGVDHGEASALTITGGTITGGGVQNAATTSTGVRTEAVDSVTINGATITGSDVIGVTKGSATVGVELRNTNLDPLTGATITNATIDGGRLAFARSGVKVQGMALSITGSTVYGTTEAGQAGSGVVVSGDFPANTPVSIDQNPEIVGGPYGGIGIHAVDQPIHITGNTLIAGCTTPCGGATGIYVASSGPGTLISGNDEIVGGPGDTSLGNHHGILLSYADATVTDNALISGNADPDNPIRMATYGIKLSYGELIAENNDLILGGHSVRISVGESQAYGIHAFSPNNNGSSDINLRDNTIIGGSSEWKTYGLLFEGNVAATVERNEVHVCAFDGDDPRCLEDNYSSAIATADNIGSVYRNNFFFAGYSGSNAACTIGCAYTLDCNSGDPANLTFANNLCYLRHGDAAMRIATFSNANMIPPLLLDNIFYVESWAGKGVVYEGGNFVNREFELRNNDFVTGGDCLVEHEDWPVCADTAAEVNALDGNAYVLASGNVSIDPLFATPSPFAPTVTGYHLDNSCALRDLGLVSVLVDEDYDGDARDDGNGAWPEIGPDECP